VNWPQAALATGDVHVWTASIAAFAHLEGALHDVLDAEESSRAARFHYAVDRTRYVVSHGVLRGLLGRYRQCPAASLQFSVGEHGKPHLVAEDGGQAASLCFNLSHSGDVALVAVTSETPVGADVERWSRRLDDDEIARIAAFVFSPDEQLGLGELESAHRLEAFFATWSRKEAYIKATGAGLSYGLDHFDVSHTRGDARLLADRRDPESPVRWALHDLAMPPGYSGAVASDARCSRLCRLEATPHLLGDLH
jgi:4'-phosphopantetheinyl transferase